MVQERASRATDVILPATRPLRPRAVLFDFDGTLAETEPSGLALDRQAFERLGITIDEDEARSIVGTDGVASIQRILVAHGRADLTPEDFERQRASSDVIYQRDPIQLMEGAGELLALLAEKGIELGVVSTTSAVNLDWALARSGILRHLSVVVTGDMVRARKPDPQPYELALELLGIGAEDTLAVEDSPVGIASARGAGIPTVGFEGSVIDQDTSAADLRLGSFAELGVLLGVGLGTGNGGGR